MAAVDEWLGLALASRGLEMTDICMVVVEGARARCNVESLSVQEPRVSASQAARAESVNLACDIWRWSSARVTSQLPFAEVGPVSLVPIPVPCVIRKVPRYSGTSAPRYLPTLPHLFGGARAFGAELALGGATAAQLASSRFRYGRDNRLGCQSTWPSQRKAGLFRNTSPEQDESAGDRQGRKSSLFPPLPDDRLFRSSTGQTGAARYYDLPTVLDPLRLG